MPLSKSNGYGLYLQPIKKIIRWALPLFAAFLLVSCGNKGSEASETSDAAASAGPAAQQQPPPAAPPADTTGGFDGQRAYQYTADLVAIGPHSAGTDGIHKAQHYIIGKLQSFGCMVDQEDFKTDTPVGTVAMKNIIAKVPGAKPDILLYTSHYDTKRIPNFVGADDGGSSTGVMLEFARLACQRKSAMTVWIAFFDGEEAFNFDWKDPDNTYGSRELAARMALSGDLPKVKALLLADMVGERNLVLKRESYSTPWLTDLVWSTAAKLGYQSTFVNEGSAIEDDHQSFLRRGVACVDLIDLEVPYWHTPEDTMDKVSPKSLAIVGHVLVETLPALEQKFAH
jgi:glutaminyl-peptide cyclotransferase